MSEQARLEVAFRRAVRTWDYPPHQRITAPAKVGDVLVDWAYPEPPPPEPEPDKRNRPTPGTVRRASREP